MNVDVSGDMHAVRHRRAVQLRDVHRLLLLRFELAVRRLFTLAPAADGPEIHESLALPCPEKLSLEIDFDSLWSDHGGERAASGGDVIRGYFGAQRFELVC